ncbi:MAG: septal ring lytic transglycosylase RlpA family protein [Acidobacteriia bacterium]|nr:septal ring lytic transglycosylase RlpA family protein [Terriglobia bacterium]
MPPPPASASTPAPRSAPTPAPGLTKTKPSPSVPPGSSTSSAPLSSSSIPAARPTPSPKPEAELTVPKGAKVLYAETGWASWYGPGFQKRHGANGEVFDTERMTAAHRTIPLNSIARVTNVKTQESVVVRITDRGPFVGDRVLDLSRAAARKLSVYQHGTALVRIEVVESPSSIYEGGRWCVQIGAFQDHDQASKLKEKLARRYRTAKVLQFASPVGGDWLRVLVADDSKKRAQELMRETHTDAGVFLVRMD